MNSSAPLPDDEPNAPRCLPPEGTAKTYFAKCGVHIGRHPQGYLWVTFADMHGDTMMAWSHWITPHLQEMYVQNRLEKHLYDIRHVEVMPPHSMQIALTVTSTPGARLAWVAALVRATGAAQMAQLMMTMVPWMHTRMMYSLSEAEAWLAQVKLER